MSVRLGIACFFSIIATNLSKRYDISRGPGRRLGVALEAEGRLVGALDALQRAVEERLCVARTLAGSVFSSTAKPWFWLVMKTRFESRSCTGWLAPWWPNFIFTVFAPAREAEELVAEADAEDRRAGVDDLADGLDRVVAGLRIAGAVGEEDAVGLERQRLASRWPAPGSTVTLQPRSARLRRMLCFTP